MTRGPSLSLCFACHLKGLDPEPREAPSPLRGTDWRLPGSLWGSSSGHLPGDGVAERRLLAAGGLDSQP